MSTVSPTGIEREHSPGRRVVVRTVKRRRRSRRAAAQRVWVQYYDSNALGGAFRVFQRLTSTSTSPPCGPMPDVLHLEPSIPRGTLTVCSNELGSKEAAAYWSSVELTQDLAVVSWLAGS